MANQSLQPQYHQRRPNHCMQTHPAHKTLAAASNLVNLLPTATVLAFRALIPLFTNRGISCLPANRHLTIALITVSSIICFLSSFADCFIDPSNGHVYYGIATFKGLYLFNYGTHQHYCDQETETADEEGLIRYKIRSIDVVHAFVSLIVFLVFALSDMDVQRCMVPESGDNLDVVLMNLPLGVGILASFLFTMFPTTRRGLGYINFPLHGI